MIMRKCEACKQPIPKKQYVELTMRVLQSHLGENQDAVEEVCGDYCDACVASGKAVEDLVSGLTKYKGIEDLVSGLTKYKGIEADKKTSKRKN